MNDKTQKVAPEMKEILHKVTQELLTKKHPGIEAKSIAEANGDVEKANEIYIKLRFEMLYEELVAQKNEKFNIKSFLR